MAAVCLYRLAARGSYGSPRSSGSRTAATRIFTMGKEKTLRGLRANALSRANYARQRVRQAHQGVCVRVRNAALTGKLIIRQQALGRRKG